MQDLGKILLDENNRRTLAEFVEDTTSKNILGWQGGTFNLDHISNLNAAFESSTYAAKHMMGVRRFASAFDIIKFSVESISFQGFNFEFGVFTGRTINYLATIMPSSLIYGFDSFEGLPEKWRDGFEQGSFALAGLPQVRDNVRLVKGWFDRSLPAFLDNLQSEKNVAFIHIDCDLYSSTQTVLSLLKQKIVPGTIIVFDEYFNYPGWTMHEHLALQEFCRANDRRYEYIGLVPSHQQVAIRMLK